jgi:hypothetical protein
MHERARPELIDLAAQRAGNRSFYLASALKAFKLLRAITDAELATYLGCSETNLSALGLCRRPDVDSPSLRNDTEAIAAQFGVDAASLVAVLREAASADALQRVKGTPSTGFLMAARDRTRPEKRSRKRRDPLE